MKKIIVTTKVWRLKFLWKHTKVSMATAPTPHAGCYSGTCDWTLQI